ncbi:Hypothetical predicted protein [Pelobates cultripes]|uniref:Uncharacterized protein n=2 Tax=Pelobates cultripes TaxID=61616 RepID=A0AAD1SUA0_PELCU|nr:Hypothetical predicted protein [Pelobates cultripes]
MDEVWILSVCLTLFGFFIFVLSTKSKPTPELESIVKKPSPAAAYTSYGGKRLEIHEDDLEKIMARLTNVLYVPEVKKREVPQEKRKTSPRETAEEDAGHGRDNENANETQEPVGNLPSQSQSAYQLSRHRVQEMSSPSDGVENIMDEIEQAVQETVEPDYYSRRRQHQTGSRRQWSEISGRVDADSI